MPQAPRGPEWFIDEEEKRMHFNLGEEKIKNAEEDLRGRFQTNYQGKIKYEDVCTEINCMLDNGIKVPDVKDEINNKYKKKINKEDLFDVITEIVTNRQVDHEKKRFNYDDKENKDVT